MADTVTLSMNPAVDKSVSIERVGLEKKLRCVQRHCRGKERSI
jgi:hypothetical protein